MNLSDEILDSVYLEYFQISDSREYEKIRYYENNGTAIRTLPKYNQLEIFTDYCFCLFRVSAHNEYLRQVDSLIFELTHENISDFGGINVYNKLLYYKALAKYHEYDYESALYILSELIKIDKSERKYKDAYLKYTLVQERSRAQKIRSIFLSLILLAGFITGIELLVIRSFYDTLSNNFELIRNAMVMAALFLLFAFEIYIRIKAKIELNRIIK